MQTWTCGICQYVYDPVEGDLMGDIQPGIAFEDLPEEWVCPVCGASKADFNKD